MSCILGDFGDDRGAWHAKSGVNHIVDYLLFFNFLISDQMNVAGI